MSFLFWDLPIFRGGIVVKFPESVEQPRILSDQILNSSTWRMDAHDLSSVVNNHADRLLLP